MAEYFESEKVDISQRTINLLVLYVLVVLINMIKNIIWQVYRQVEMHIE